MYLLKQWRESRLLLAVAAAGLLLLLSMMIKVAASAGRLHAAGGDVRGFFIVLFGLEAVAIGALAWALGSIGAGKNIGEKSGSYLFTRPRKRQWFVWRDWLFAAAALAITIGLLNVIVGFFCAYLMHLAGLPLQRIPLQNGGNTSLVAMMALEAAGVLALAGLLYGLSYLCAVIAKRSSGVLISAGVLAGYSVLSVVIAHVYRVALPSFTPPLLLMHDRQLGIAPHVAFGIGVRMLLALVFAVAAQQVLRRSEI